MYIRENVKQLHHQPSECGQFDGYIQSTSLFTSHLEEKMYTIRDETTGTESRTNLTKKSWPAKRQNEWLRSSIPPSASSFPSNPFPFIFFLSFFLFLFLLTHQHRYCSTLLCPSFPCAVVEISPSNPWRKKKRKVVHNSIMSTQHIEPAGKKQKKKKRERETPFEHVSSSLSTLLSFLPKLGAT